MRVLVVNSPTLAQALKRFEIQIIEASAKEAPVRLEDGSFHTVVVGFKDLRLVSEVQGSRVFVTAVVVSEEEATDTHASELLAFKAGADDFVCSSTDRR